MGSLSLGLRRFEHEMMEDQSDEEVEEDTYSFHGVGKRWPCARDLVAECRRCGTVVCRVSHFFPLIFLQIGFELS